MQLTCECCLVRQYFGLQSHIPAFIFEDIPSLVLNILFIIKLGKENFNYVAGASLCCSFCAGTVKLLEIRRWGIAYLKAYKKGLTATKNATGRVQSFRLESARKSKPKSTSYIVESGDTPHDALSAAIAEADRINENLSAEGLQNLQIDKNAKAAASKPTLSRQ